MDTATIHLVFQKGTAGKLAQNDTAMIISQRNKPENKPESLKQEIH